MLKIESFSGEYAHFKKMKEIFVLRKERLDKYSVECFESSGKYWLMKLVGVDTPEDGRKLANCELYAHRKDACSLSNGEYYITDILNCTVIFGGKGIGSVAGWYDIGHSILLEVMLEDNRSVLVPFHDEFIGRIDIEKSTLEITAEWIIE